MNKCCQDKEKNKAVIGIDFGTSNCVISYIDKNGILKFINQKNATNNLIPSKITFKNNECIFGNNICENNDTLIIKSIKRIIGLDRDEIYRIKDLLPFKITELENRSIIDVDCVVCISKKIDKIVLEMMKQLKKIVLDYFDNNELEIQAVITVPAYFDEKARNIIKKNALIAGIIVIQLINEPTAAAIAYQGLTEGSSYLVYDLGGGTFDVSIIKKYKNNFFRVLGIGGDKFLGGDDFDKAIANNLINKNIEQDNLLQKAKQIKENFNSEKIFSDEEFLKILSPTLNKTFKIMDDVLEDVKNKFEDLKIENIILVGGSTRLPIIKKILSEKFNVLDHHNPDEIVAYGAGLHSHEIVYKKNSHKLLDAIGMSFGLEVSGNSVEVLIEKNSQIPISKTKIFTTQVDHQKSMRIAICQGESKKFSNNIILGQYSLTNLPESQAYTLEIEVTFSIDVDGILTVTARELKRDNAICISFHDII